MATKPRIVIWGAAGHALVVADVVKLAGKYEIVGFIDDVCPGRQGSIHGGYEVLGGRERLNQLRRDGVTHILFGFGNNTMRLALAGGAEKVGFEFGTAIHPSATVAADSAINAGTVVMPGAVINPACRIGCHCIINNNASVAHECVIGDAVHLSPGVNIAGGVTIGNCTWLGIGAVCRDHIRIGARSVIGAGAVIVRDIPDDVTAYGVPARIKRGDSHPSPSEPAALRTRSFGIF